MDSPKRNIEHSIPERLGSLVQRYGHRPALAAPGSDCFTYAQLFAQITYAVGALNHLGIGRGDRVALVLGDGPRMASACLGVMAGAVCAPLNPQLREAEFVALFGDLQPKALVLEAGSKFAAGAAAERLSIPIVELIPEQKRAGHFTLRGVKHTHWGCGGFGKADDTALVLFTSGTTVRPKLVPLTHANLLVSSANIAATLDLTPLDRCLSIMPLFHIHGLIGGLLASLVSGGSVFCLAGFLAENFFGWVKEFQPTWYTSVPTMHRAILTQAKIPGEIGQEYRPRFIRSSSAPLPKQVMEELETIFRAPVVESYGMTEAAHQIASNPLPPGERKPGSVGKAAGPEVAIMDGEGYLRSVGTIGEVVIRGANIMAGYVKNAEANSTAFTEGWFRTGDQGYLDGDGYLFLTGRIKELINRDGEKISPREIDDVLLTHPAVERAAAFGIPHSTLGEELAAAVVLHPQMRVTVSELREFVGIQLADFKVPKQIMIVNEIPTTATGKLRRKSLAERFALQFSAETVAAENQLELMVAKIYAEVLGVETIGATDNFFVLGGDSLRATQVIARIRALLNVNLSLATFFWQPTARALAREILRLIAETNDDSMNTGGKTA